MHKIRGAVALTRWKEYLFNVIPVTLIGPLVSSGHQIPFLDPKLYLVLTGNFLAKAFAFMVNDVEDAQDDKLTPGKLQRNPVSNGTLSPAEGYIVSLAVFAAAAAVFFLLGPAVFWLGLANLVLSFLYSFKPVRLKKWPVLDLVSHGVMLGGLPLTISILTFSPQISGAVTLLIAATILISGYGQIYNQLRDFGADRKTGLKNTSQTLSRKWSARLGYVLLVLGGTCVLTALIIRIIPFWALLPLPFVLLFYILSRSRSDQPAFSSSDLPLGYLLMNSYIAGWALLSAVFYH